MAHNRENGLSELDRKLDLILLENEEPIKVQDAAKKEVKENFEDYVKDVINTSISKGELQGNIKVNYDAESGRFTIIPGYVMFDSNNVEETNKEIIERINFFFEEYSSMHKYVNVNGF